MVFVHHSLFISLPEEILHPESHFVPVAARNHSIIISNCNILGQAQTMIRSSLSLEPVLSKKLSKSGTYIISCKCQVGGQGITLPECHKNYH
jgi:hypothetical protein